MSWKLQLPSSNDWVGFVVTIVVTTTVETPSAASSKQQATEAHAGRAVTGASSTRKIVPFRFAAGLRLRTDPTEGECVPPSTCQSLFPPCLKTCPIETVGSRAIFLACAFCTNSHTGRQAKSKKQAGAETDPKVSIRILDPSDPNHCYALPYARRARRGRGSRQAGRPASYLPFQVYAGNIVHVVRVRYSHHSTGTPMISRL